MRTAHRASRTVALGLAWFLSACAAGPAGSLADGPWHAWLDSPGGELPFGLDLQKGPGGMRAFLVNDASAYLVELDRRFRGRGLSILGLAFEMTGSFERDVRQLRAYAAYHGIDYPLLVAGTADKDEASTAFPLVDRVRAYPTLIFMDADARVRAVYSGFAGPATGEAHRELRAGFESLIEGLLGGADPAGAVMTDEG